jgi:spore germination cell wall hydrolase CwlJ-like protein
MTVTDKDRDVLARTIWGEARGEGMAGMIAVGWAIRNRVNDGNDKSWWGEGYAGVCQAPYQFSCWNKNDPNYPYLSGAKPIPKSEFAKCQAASIAVIDGTMADPTGGATHYYAATMPRPPGWTGAATKTTVIGQHIFFKDVP